jgi:hypothetical protein
MFITHVWDIMENFRVQILDQQSTSLQVAVILLTGVINEESEIIQARKSRRYCLFWRESEGGRSTNCSFFCNPILIAICTSTFSKLCKHNMYTVVCRRVLNSAPL